MEASCNRYSVCAILDYSSEVPLCSHGPMLLFQKNNDVHQRYFACSAYRDRKQCSAYIPYSEWTTAKKKDTFLSHSMLGGKDLQERSERMDLIRQTILPVVASQSSEDRHYCHTCDELFLDKQLHQSHNISATISDDALSSPLQLMQPLSNNKKEAQFLFNNTSRDVIASLVANSKTMHCLCIASPTIFQHLRKTTRLNCLMLDLDVRLRQFFGTDQYLLYNMFNHYFFDGAQGEGTFISFLKQSAGSLTLVLDPPFGGKVDVLANTLKKIVKQYSDLIGEGAKVSVFLILPYFMEPQVIRQLPDFAMMDYKVNYLNHKQFQEGDKGRKQGSPVRIFTNVPLEYLPLPKEEGYSFCKFCKKWKSKENKHCFDCGSCTSKDGRTYVHCQLCKRCVKPTWLHCTRCNRCALENHPCDRFRLINMEKHEIGHNERESFLPGDGTPKRQFAIPLGLKRKNPTCYEFCATSKWIVTNLNQS